jgi:riboflavin synthase
MFTGLIEAVGIAAEVRKGASETNLAVLMGSFTHGVRVGDSIAVAGACCTVTAIEGPLARFVLSTETVARTWFGQLVPEMRLNLEQSLRAGQPMGGHIVQGHVDAVGKVTQPVDPMRGGRLGVALPRRLLRYCADKGSIAIDGVSLTIAAISDDTVEIAVIPHTAQNTTLGRVHAGQHVNVEADIIAKYVERLLRPPA